MRLQVLPARTGLAWLSTGVRTFARQPLALVGLFLMYVFGIGLVATLLPWIGPLIALLLVPAGTVGLMAVSHAVMRQSFPRPGLLLVALRGDAGRRRAMLALGVFYVAGLLAAVAAASLLDGGTMAQWLSSGQPPTPESIKQQPALPLALGVMMVLQLLLTALMWFAPALVHWRGVPALKSLFFSAVVFWRNWRAFTVFGLASGGALMGVVLLTTLIGTALGSTTLAAALLQFVVLVATALGFPCMMASFIDCFGEPEAESGAAPRASSN